ncbi:MAG: CBS domain-containing protein [Natrialbaceae archaeon]|nr:CBS domain-containing protein [Natrialbaceae archaeon]
MESVLTVGEVLTTDYVGVSESDSVLGTVRLMRDDRAACALVMRGSEPVGIVTEWDILGVVADEIDPTTTTVEEVMSSPVLRIDAGTPVSDGAEYMARENIRNLVVEADDEIVGMLTQRDVITVAGSYGQATSPQSPAEPETMGTQANGGEEYSTQGVCEVCGTLADSLYESNGRLVCTDCRSV